MTIMCTIAMAGDPYALQRDAMLDKYAQAVRDKVVDREALENAVLALSDDKSRDRAMLVLSDWVVVSYRK